MLFFLFSIPIWAAMTPPAQEGSTPQLLIKHMLDSFDSSIDPITGAITIEGDNFDNGNMPAVTLDDQSLVVTDYYLNHINAELSL